MTDIFYVDKSIYDQTKWMVKIKPEIKKDIKTEGNDSVLLARLFGLSYCDCYRMIRSRYKAILYGRHGNYIGIAIPDKSLAEDLCKELNERWNYIALK